MKNSLSKMLSVSKYGAFGSIFFVGNLLYGAESVLPGAGESIGKTPSEGSCLTWESRPKHGGYCEQKVRPLVVTTPEGRTHLFQVPEATIIGQLRSMLVDSGLVTNGEFEILYRGRPVLSKNTNKVGDEGDYLVHGDSLYTIKYLESLVLKTETMAAG